MEPISYVVITVVGADRPGIVEEISGWILEHGGNIESSRMAQLGGEFAAVILAAGKSNLAQDLEKSRAQVESKHKLTVFTKLASAGYSAPGPMLRYTLQATSLDHPGIVHGVAQLLRQLSVNIVAANTQTSSAPFSGAPVFQFSMEIDLPASLPVSKLREQLGELGNRDNIDFVLAAKP